MTPEEIREVLIQVIIEIQTSSGRQVPTFHDESCPIGDCEGFDSINAVEATCLLSEYMDCKIQPDLMLPTYPGRQLTINEIVSRLQRAIGAQGE